MKVIIAGTRDFDNRDEVFKAIEQSGFDITEVVLGASGAVDLWGQDWAIGNRMPYKLFPPDWKQYGRAAGPIRNQLMAEYADALIAVWDGKSPGTKNMIMFAKEYKLKIYVHEVKID